MIAMTDLLEKAVAAVRGLPASSQDDIARVMLMLVSDDQAPVSLTPEEEASIAESLAQAARGEFATDEQVRAVWAKHGL
jgi:predicted transcriptional regulator